MATLGNTVDVGATDNNGTGTLLVGADSSGTPYVLATASVASKMTAKLLHSTTGSQKLRLVVYRDSSGSPGALHAVSNEVTVDSTNAGTASLIDFPFASTISFPAGSYWVGVWFGTVVTNNAIISKLSVASPNNQRYNLTATYSSVSNPPDPFPTPSSAAGEYVVYVTVSAIQKLVPDADNDASTWTTTPLWSKVDEAVAGGDVITATAA